LALKRRNYIEGIGNNVFSYRFYPIDVPFNLNQKENVMKSDYTKYLDKIYRREKNNARAKAKRLLKKYEGNGLTVVMDERFACSGDWRTNRWDVNRPTWIEEKDDLLGDHTANDWIEALEMLEKYIAAIGSDIDQRTVDSMLYEQRLERIMEDSDLDDDDPVHVLKALDLVVEACSQWRNLDEPLGAIIATLNKLDNFERCGREISKDEAKRNFQQWCKHREDESEWYDGKSRDLQEHRRNALQEKRNANRCYSCDALLLTT
jgi:hypothetical protein